jgi:hypothetical protein
VTAEFAMALPAVVLVVAVLVLTLAAGSAQLRCAEAARTAARVAALGETDSEVASAARRVAGDGASVHVARSVPWVEVQVSSGVAGTWLTAGPLLARATSTAWVEP